MHESRDREVEERRSREQASPVLSQEGAVAAHSSTAGDIHVPKPQGTRITFWNAGAWIRHVCAITLLGEDHTCSRCTRSKCWDMAPKCGSLKLNLLAAAAAAATSCTFRLACSSTSCMPAAHKQRRDFQTCLSAAAACTFCLHCYETFACFLACAICCPIANNRVCRTHPTQCSQDAVQQNHMY
ncbi:hypothetical protein COO60DRAFT_326236 [Scenedesmus sp. NREL 46B-D3]|nr:hypothetical protein COO60DRAFT_326236 [Scenedesmus sp. NREL 46B-D3]